MIDINAIHEKIASLRALGTDTQDVEVKAAFGGLPKELPETISAFANGNGGLLILGLDENNNFTTSEKFDAQAITDGLQNTAATKVYPAIRPLFIETIPIDGHSVVVAQIPAIADYDKPAYVTNKGMYRGSYIRTADGDHLLQRYEIDRLLEQSHQPSWDLEIVHRASLDDLDDELTNRIIAREKEIHPRIFGKASTLQAMHRLNIIATDSDGTVRPTLAGLLALGTYPQQFFPQLSITFTHYRGITKASDASGIRYTDTLTIEGPIPLLIEEATRKVQEASPRGAIMRGAFRYDLFDFPPVAVREAITNAVMHRDYSPEARGTQVQVDLFADRLEVRNPGGLYGTVTVDTLGTDGISSSRNLALSRILESTPYLDDGFVAENRGSGYQEILDKLHRDLLPPPEVRNSLTRFALLFYKRGETEDTPLTKHAESSAHAHSIAHSKPAANTSTREAIVDYLRAHDSASTKELADAAGVTAETIRRSLRQLLTEKLVHATAPQRSPKQRYRLAQLAPCSTPGFVPSE